MREEKIITMYPTVVKPGLSIAPLMTADPLILASRYPSVFSFYLTAIMYFEHGRKYTTELDVTFNGESVLPDNNADQNRMETFMFSPINESFVAVGTSLYVKDAKLLGDGIYEVIYRIYEDVDGNLSDVIDEKKCALISTIPSRGKE
ncbi:hypothetical protein NFT50_001271 [Salmonella enterica]|nr:hypothetical protein [Salmonella enterica]EJH7438229.1 hypothetical protein [Salmonella enterica]EJH7877523.1 hypothetical protein [Salmonella enterica]EJI6710237.1 hypothetical protein [Salmonella enterica]